VFLFPSPFLRFGTEFATPLLLSPACELVGKLGEMRTIFKGLAHFEWKNSASLRRKRGMDQG